MKVFSVEKANKEIEDHLKNLTDVKKKMETESQLQIADLMEQLTIFEEVKEKEVGELNRKCNEALTRMNSAENSSESNLMAVQRREAELLLQIKELEVSSLLSCLSVSDDSLPTGEGGGDDATESIAA
jgi:hypothetical protein